MEMPPGVHRLKIPIPESTLQYVNCYLLKGSKGYLLVDTGWDNHTAFDSLQRQLGELNIDIHEISQIVVTHIHPDHYGLVGKIKETSGAEFACHEKDKALIDSRYIHMDELIRKTGEWLRDNGAPVREVPRMQKASLPVAQYVAPTYPDVLLRDGQIYATGVFNLKVIWTPGHSPGHICLYEPERKFLLSGDHILPNITPNIGLNTQSGANPLGDFLNSLHKIEKLDVDLVLPAHENPFEGLPSRIEKLRQHHRQRNANILSALPEPKTAYQIAQGITWLSDIGGIGWQHLTIRDKRLAVLETLSHLELMRSEGNVSRFSRDGMLYYQKT